MSVKFAKCSSVKTPEECVPHLVCMTKLTEAISLYMCVTLFKCDHCYFKKSEKKLGRKGDG